MEIRKSLTRLASADSPFAKTLILIAIALALFARRPDAFISPQFWAEDGPIFFLQQYQYGASAIATPTAGYLLLIPRLIAFFSQTFFDYAHIPRIYSLSSLTATLLVASSILSPRLRIKYKGLLALSLVLIPHYGNEVFLTITNIQWISCLLLVLVILKCKPDRQYGHVAMQQAADIFAIIIIGLTGPFLVVLLPLFLWKWKRESSKYNCLIAAIALLISAIQLTIIFSHSSNSGLSTLDLDIKALSAFLGFKVFGGLYLGSLASFLNRHLLTVLYIISIFAIIKANPPQSNLIYYCLYAHFAFLAVSLLRDGGPTALLPKANGLRYLYIPYVMIAWCLIIELEGANKRIKIAAITLLAMILFSSITSKFQTSYIDYNWHYYSQKIGKEELSIPINPKGWQINIKPGKQPKNQN
jgi:hypothetical protein